MRYNKLFLQLFLLFLSTSLTAQTPITPPQQDTTQKLKVEFSDFGEYFLIAGSKYTQKLSGNVKLRQENTLVYCDTAIINGDNATLYGHVVMEQGDTVNVFADSALYYGGIRQSDLFGDVVLVNGVQKLFTNKLHYDLGNKIATYHKGATMSNGKSQLKSKHGYYFVNDHEIFFKGDVLVTDPDFTVRSDTMAFNTETQVVRFLAPTLISQTDSRIYCEGGFYDIQDNFAEFDLNPQFEKKDQKGRAKKMRYNGANKEYTLEGDAYIEEKTKKVDADVIIYNTETEVAVLNGNAHYRDSTQDIQGERIKYDSRQKKYQISGRSRIVSDKNIITADSLDFNDQLGNGLATGNVIWVDTASNYTILANRMDYNKQSEYLHATGGFGNSLRPMMKSLIEKDTLYMSAEQLTSYKPDTLSDARLLLAHQDVRIFKSDLQAVCDSLSYSSVDSIFRFYRLTQIPIIWSDTSQFSADTIRMAMKNQKMDRIWLRENALVVNSEDGLLFNQIKGRNITAFFKEDQVREMLVDTKAEAVYFALDDKKAYIGANQTECAQMRLFFGDNKVNSIKFYTQPKGKFVPMKKMEKEPVLLAGFFWDKVRRPQKLEDLF
jgi:lipopolysaccharide export system protein LptA